MLPSADEYRDVDHELGSRRARTEARNYAHVCTDP